MVTKWLINGIPCVCEPRIGRSRLVFKQNFVFCIREHERRIVLHLSGSSVITYLPVETVVQRTPDIYSRQAYTYNFRDTAGSDQLVVAYIVEIIYCSRNFIMQQVHIQAYI